MPNHLHGFTVANADMSYTIVLNASNSYEQNVITYQHEMEHIKHGDCEKKLGADVIEMFAHEGSAQ